MFYKFEKIIKKNLNKNPVLTNFAQKIQKLRLIFTNYNSSYQFFKSLSNYIRFLLRLIINLNKIS